VAQLSTLGHIDITKHERNITSMKIFNIKIAVRAFGALLALDAVLFTLLYLVPSSLSAVLWWIVNFSGHWLLPIVGRFLYSHGVVVYESTQMIGVGLLCITMWSALIGFIFRGKAVA